MNWKELVTLVPALGILESDVQQHAQAYKGKAKYCANWHWYNSFKPRLEGLVGWERPRWPDEDPRLYTSGAWDVSYKHLYELLPSCKNCMCF